MHVYMYNTFNIHAILVYVTYLMYDYIYTIACICIQWNMG